MARRAENTVLIDRAVLKLLDDLMCALLILHILDPQLGISLGKGDIPQPTLRILIEDSHRNAGMTHQSGQEMRLRQIGCLINPNQPYSHPNNDIPRLLYAKTASGMGPVYYLSGREITKAEPPRRLSLMAILP